MDMQVRVDVALRRPPAVHAQRHVLVSVELDAGLGLNAAMAAAEVEARQVASEMVSVHADVVMALGARVTEVLAV